MSPVLKRGPKTSKLLRRHNEKFYSKDDAPRARALDRQRDREHTSARRHDITPPELEYGKTQCLPFHILAPFIEAYRSRMYPVWPVVDTNNLLARLEVGDNDQPDSKTYILATALCSATMAQLNLAPMTYGSSIVDSAYMEAECLRVRNATNYRENPSLGGVLSSFFLHVYHAKSDKRNAAMVFLQEAISLARLLHLDDFKRGTQFEQEESQKRLCYILLWVSERYMIWSVPHIAELANRSVEVMLFSTDSPSRSTKR